MPVETNKTFGPCTLNNYTEEDIEWLKRLECNVLTCSKEIGESGTPHLQFSITFNRSYSFEALKKLHNKISWRKQMCSQDNNYCRKRDSELIIDRDERKKKGGRSDLELSREIVKSTNSLRAVIEHTMNLQAIRSAEIYLKYNEPQRKIQKIIVEWYWGESNVGKTRKVYEDNNIEDVFRPITHKWWEGYDGHKIVLIDDMREKWCSFEELLRLLDIYPYRVETKGGSRQIQATKFYITSAKPPKEIYTTNEDTFQLERRISNIIEFKR